VPPKVAERPAFLSVTNDPAAPLVAASDFGIFTSTDAGRNWNLVHPRSIGATTIAYTPRLAFISRGAMLETRDLALRRLRGAVRPWPFHRVVYGLASDPYRHRIWALARAPRPELYYSVDDGRHWYISAAIGICPRPRAIAATGGPRADAVRRLYVACGLRGLYVSDNLGVSFGPLAGSPSQVGDVSTAFKDPTVVAVVTPVVRVSHDAGATWRAGPLTAIRVAVDPRNPDLIFAIAQNGRLFASDDGGKSF